MQRLTQKLPTLDYLSWADRGMPRPEAYTKENLTDYVPRIEQLANYPGRLTKEMKREAREILKSTQAKGISGSVGDLRNYTPYTSAMESGDEALANERMRQFYKLDSVVHGKQNAISHGFMDGLGILPLEKAWMNVIGGPEGAKGFQNVEAGMQKAAEMYPVLNQMAYFNGKTVQLAVLRKLVGAGVTALGGSGPIARVIQGMVTFGGSEAIQNLGDFVAGKMTPEQYWTSVEHSVRTGGALAGLMELIPAARRDLQEWFSQRKAGKGGSTALVPATSAPEPVGMEEELPMPEEDYYEAFEKGFNYDEEEFVDPLDTKNIESVITENAENGQVVEAEEDAADFDDLYEQMYPDSVDPYSKIRYNSDGTIVVTDDWTNRAHPRINAKYRPNAVVDVVSHQGQHDRIIYDENGYFKTFIHGGDHNQPKYHQYGEHGEHAHDVIFDPVTWKMIDKIDRELTAEERIQYADIIRRRK